MALNLTKGDCFRIPYEDRTREYTFVRKVAGGSLIFVDGVTGRPEPFDEKKVVKMIADRVAVRLLPSNWLDRIDIYAFMDVSASTSLETRKKIQAAQDKVAEAAMLLFYVVRLDAAGDTVSNSKDGLNAFIDKHYDAALRSGHVHKPSYSAVGRAMKKGIPHQRCLPDFISKRGKHPKRKWLDPWVTKKLGEAVEFFYSEGNPKPPQLNEAVDRFLAEAILEDRDRKSRGETDGLKHPKRTAVENHIRGQETEERLAKRDPMAALRQYGGKADGAKASFPLEKVQVDQTQIDQWINIYDEDGNVEDRKRPWLVSIIDVYSRMILAAVLTFDKPSNYTVQLAIKQMLRPKLFLIERYGRKPSTDGSGQPKEMTFDNGVENVHLSMRLLLADAGIDMEVAPIGTPQAKAIVERGFQTFNQGIWHSAPGGIPYKPPTLSARRLKPEEKAQWALDFATGVMWDWIVNVHHMDRNRTLEGIPARLWSDKVNDPMVGRAVSKKLDLVEVLCGERKRLKINGVGVIYDTHVFHHQKVTEEFLRNTVPHERRSNRGKVDIEAIIYPHDCSYITIIDPVMNRFVRLPNSKPRYAEGLSYAEAKSIQATDRKLDRDFVSEGDLLLAKYNYYKLKDSARAQARAERAILQAKKARKKAADEELVVWTLADGNYIETGSIEPTVRGDAVYDVPQDPPATTGKSRLIAHKDAPRGAGKARETREKNRLIKELRAAAETKPTPGTPVASEPLSAVPAVANPTSFLDQLAADLD